MNCKRCNHTDQAHEHSQETTSLMKAGSCKIPDCTCKQYQDKIKEIDEDLL